MTRINSRAKGAAGEREFCTWLFENMNVPMPTRNLEQVRSGGADIIEIEPFFFEVKRCEQLSLFSWWIQVSKAVKSACNPSIIPVVAFRQNRMDWEFLIPAKEIGVEKGFLRISERTFLQWCRNKIKR